MARNPRAAAQRATARAVRENRRQLPSSVTSRAVRTRESYLQGVLNGSIPTPAAGTPEANSLASAASKARWGKADPAYEAAWSRFWYKHRQTNNPDEEEEEREEEGEEEG